MEKYKIIAIENFLWSPHIETSLEYLINYKSDNKAFCFLNIPNPDNPDLPNNRFKIFGIKRILNQIKNILKKHNVAYIEPSTLNDFDYLKIRKLKNIRFSSFHDISKYYYKDANIGFGVASSLVDKYKQLEPNLKQIKKTLLNDYINSSVKVFLYTNRIISLFNPNTIITFNGRFAHAAAIKISCKQNKVKTIFHERSDYKERYFAYSEPPHDMSWWRKEIIKNWNNSKDSISNKTKIATRWFEKRQSNLFSDGLNHRQYQIKNNIPLLDKKKKIISFFSHSDEEYAYCSELKHPIFSSQRKAILWLIDFLKNKKDTTFVIRIHPNLRNKHKNDFNWWHKTLVKNKINNIILLGSYSKVDSYQLVKYSDLVVCFCSASIGIEATYLGVPSIILGDSQYKSSNSAYHPQNINDLKKLLNAKNLSPKPKKNSYPFAYFRETYGHKYKIYKPITNYTGTFEGYKFSYYPNFFKFIKNIYK
jgi:hypothetical protein